MLNLMEMRGLQLFDVALHTSKCNERGHVDEQARREANEFAVRHFLSSWDPSWRWSLVIGLRELWLRRRSLGAQMIKEGGDQCWGADDHLYGPVSLGLAASALNEVAQYCEDLFALTAFIREPYDFVERITKYNAGRVTGLASKLADASNERLRGLFMFPDRATISVGLAQAENPTAAEAAVQDAEAVLGELVRRIANWYETNSFFHNQYKHGLKIGMQPFGAPPGATITARREGEREVAVFAFQNEPMSNMLRRPPSQQVLQFPMLPEHLRPHLSELIENRALLQYQSTRVNIDELVAHSMDVMRLQKTLITNRLSLLDGLDSNSQQHFVLPRQGPRGTLQVELRLVAPVQLAAFPRLV